MVIEEVFGLTINDVGILISHTKFHYRAISIEQNMVYLKTVRTLPIEVSVQFFFFH